MISYLLLGIIADDLLLYSTKEKHLTAVGKKTNPMLLCSYYFNSQYLYSLLYISHKKITKYDKINC